MKREQVRLTDTQKDSFGLIYYCIKNALEVSQSLQVDKNLSTIIRYNFIRLWVIMLGNIKNQMDKALGCNSMFAEQIKETDTLGLHEIIKGYIALDPEGREAVENIFTELNKKGTIEFNLKDAA